ncbi:MAG: polysaccharide pyruvyl transferase family protein [Candidatus Paceibacterota bacterium]
MKIVITNAYARKSGGDMAILSSLIFELRRVFKNPDIIVATIDDPAKMCEALLNVKCMSSLITSAWGEKTTRINKLFTLLRSHLSAILWSLVYRYTKKQVDWLLKKNEKEEMHQLAEADLVIGVGGGYIREGPGIMKIIDLVLVLRMLSLSLFLGKKTFLYSQSIGPFSNRAQEKFAACVLKRMQLIVTRESVSRRLLKKMGVSDKIVLESTDAAFLIRNQNCSLQPLPAEVVNIKKDYVGPLVGVTAREWLSADSQEKFEKEFARALDEISEKYDAHILFIPQTTFPQKDDDDRIVQKRIFENMQQKNRATCMEGSYEYQELLSIYDNLDFLIGTRFHSAIFTLIAKVPTLVIAYEHKAVGIMEDLGLAAWVLDIREVNAPLLVDSFARLCEQREEYLNQLNGVLPAYIIRAERAVERIKEVYCSSNK